MIADERPTDLDSIAAAFAEPFPPDVLEWKPQSVSGNRALAVAYIDARAVMDRLDDVLGIGNWQTSYRELPDGSVVCRLRVRIIDEWCEQEDVGSPSEQPDGGDRMKAAFSDSLKRVAVHLGIGRYLYRLPSQWVDYDPKTRQFAKTPTLPPWARPAGAPTAQPVKPVKPVAAAAKPANGNPGDGCISREQANQIGAALRLQKWTTAENAPDFSGVLAAYRIERLGLLPVIHLADVLGKIHQRHPSMAPVQAQEAQPVAQQ